MMFLLFRVYIFYLLLIVTNSTDINVTCYSSCVDFADAVECGSSVSSTARLFEVGDQNCHCDTKCVIFDDCCPDYKSICNSRNETTLKNSYSEADVLNHLGFSIRNDSQWANRRSCHGNMDADSFYYVQTCPSGDREWSYPGLGKFNSECCMSPGKRKFGHSTPVTHIISGISYKNIYCAVCNGVPLREAALWDTIYYCEQAVENVNLQKTVTRKVVSRVSEGLNALHVAVSTELCHPKYEISAAEAPVRMCYNDQTGVEDNEECVPNPTFAVKEDLMDLPDGEDRLVEEHGFQRYSVQFRSEERLILTMFGKRRTYEMDVCEMLPHPDLCWTLTKLPTCVQQLSTESFAAFDFDVREPAENCAIYSKVTRKTLMVIYVIGRFLSCIILLVLICIKRSSISDKKASNFEKNAVTFLMFLWMKSVFHLLQYTLDCRSVAMFVHFLQDSAFMWLFVMGYDLHLERRDLMPPFLYLMTSWVLPLIIAIIGAIMSLGRIGIYWLYTETNVCWYTPLYWELPEMIIPFACNFYTLALTVSKLKNGLDSTPHHMKFLVLFPLLFLDYMLPMFAAYLDSEVYLSITLILQAYWGIIMAVAFFIITFNDHRLDSL